MAVESAQNLSAVPTWFKLPSFFRKHAGAAPLAPALAGAAMAVAAFSLVPDTVGSYVLAQAHPTAENQAEFKDSLEYLVGDTVIGLGALSLALYRHMRRTEEPSVLPQSAVSPSSFSLPSQAPSETQTVYLTSSSQN